MTEQTEAQGMVVLRDPAGECCRAPLAALEPWRVPAEQTAEVERLVAADDVGGHFFNVVRVYGGYYTYTMPPDGLPEPRPQMPEHSYREPTVREPVFREPWTRPSRSSE